MSSSGTRRAARRRALTTRTSFASRVASIAARLRTWCRSRTMWSSRRSLATRKGTSPTSLTAAVLQALVMMIVRIVAEIRGVVAIGRLVAGAGAGRTDGMTGEIDNVVVEAFIRLLVLRALRRRTGARHGSSVADTRASSCGRGTRGPKMQPQQKLSRREQQQQPRQPQQSRGYKRPTIERLAGHILAATPTAKAKTSRSEPYSGKKQRFSPVGVMQEKAALKQTMAEALNKSIGQVSLPAKIKLAI